jgi:alkylation response protein AidB-like acyl-CoA dehydrogenase
MSYLADLRREMDFILFDWLDTTDQDHETASAILDLSYRLAGDMFAPHHRLADQSEPTMGPQGVCVLPEIKHALTAYAKLGLFGASFSPELGGMGLSHSLNSASFLFFAAANLSTSAYSMLTVANARLIATFGTPQQIDAFAKPQIEGRWFGTMCLSEPQAGSNLGDITTRARRDGEDELGVRYRLSGYKMWISGGEHDAAENIVHLVLAKAVNASGETVTGTQGISLFVVPRILLDGTKNDVVVAGLNHKLGYRGIPNCALNLGEGAHHPMGDNGAIGWRIGTEGDGLRQMFRMMNEARIGVSLGAAALGYRGFRQARLYATERIQGRPVGAAHDDISRVAIIDHPDVKRMLMQQKLYSEGALALTMYCAALVDEKADMLLALLTPVVKSWTSTWALKANDIAIQVHGGYGYTRDYDVEMLWRDNRLNPIHEGTNGIQAIDLVERKILNNNGLAIVDLEHRIGVTIASAGKSGTFSLEAKELARVWDLIITAIRQLKDLPQKEVLAHASPFLDAFGHVIVGWLWLDQALACTGREDAVARGKRRACSAFYSIEIPNVSAWLQPITTNNACLSSLRVDEL